MFVPRFAELTAIASCLALCAASGAQAQADPTAAARDLFHEGLELADAQRWEEAAARFERAYELRRSAPIAVNWARALEQSGHWVQASELLARVRRDETADEETRQLAEQRFEDLRARFPHLTIRLSGATAGVSVTLDDQPVDPGLFHVSFPIDPGAHELVATRGDETVARRTFSVSAREEHEEAITVAPSAAVAASSESGASEPASEAVYETWWFWTILGVVVAGAVATSVGLVIALDGQAPAPVEGNGLPPILRVGP